MERQAFHMVSADVAKYMSRGPGEASLLAGREESLGSLFGFLLHHSGGVLGYLTAAGAQVEVQAPHWAFAAVSARGATDSSGEFG